jgi:hypothetical protein
MRDAFPNERVHSSSGLARHVADSSRRVAYTCPACVCSQQACSQVQNMEEYAWYAEYAGYDMLLGIARGCGFPTDTVKVTPPPLDTCKGAFGKWGELWSAPCAREKKAGDGEEEHTPASCGNAECAALISSIDDDVLAKMKQGLKVCQSVGAHLRQ